MYTYIYYYSPLHMYVYINYYMCPLLIMYSYCLADGTSVFEWTIDRQQILFYKQALTKHDIRLIETSHRNNIITMSMYVHK